MRLAFGITVILLVLMGLPSAAYSGMIEVRPTTLLITPAQRIAVLSLINPEARPAIYQARIYRWRQDGDQQSLDPTDDVIASPPMISLGAHGSQIVRIGLRSGAAPDQETTYRLILEEVPASNIPDLQGLNIALKLSFPLFVRPQSTLPPAQLAADMSVSGTKAVVTVRNNGLYTSRITEASLDLHDADGKDGTDKPDIKRLTYIMPHAWARYEFTLPAAPPGAGNVTLTVQTDEGAVDIDTPVMAEAASDAPRSTVR